ncbi:MAG: tRNA lysidine(34) synthetase TilS [Dehalococcoidia bacterium]
MPPGRRETGVAGSKDPKGLLEGRVRVFIEANGLAHSPGPLVVGVSGGPDSLSLLYALYHLADELGLALHIGHLNHCLRGRDSDEDAAFVADLAQQLGIPYTMGREDVALRAPGHSSSLEEKAREARYEFLAGVVEKVGASGAAVAHTADDQTETMLLHILRGAGVPGLQGMRPVTDIKSPSGKPLRLFRPLLEITREETEAYCRVLGLSPKADYTNQLPDRLRNRIRLELLPYLREYNPNIDQAIRRLGAAASLDTAFIEAEVESVWPTVVTEVGAGLRLSREKLLSLHPAPRRYLLRRALQVILGDLVDIEQVHILSLEELLSGPTGKTIHLSRGITATTEYDDYMITGVEGKGDGPSLSAEHTLQVPGVTTVPGWRVSASIMEKKEADGIAGGLRAVLDMDAVGGRLTVRGRRDGDRFQPLGMKGTKKLQDFLVDSKVPRRLRDHTPLVCAGGRIVWVVGLRIDEAAKITDETTRVVALEFHQIKT